MKHPLKIPQMLYGLCVLCLFAATLKVQASEEPKLVELPPAFVLADQPYSFSPTLDIPADHLYFELVNAPEWMTYDMFTGSITGTPTVDDIGGYYDIGLNLSDGVETQYELALFYVDVLPLPLTEDNLVAEGNVVPTENGFEVQGEMNISANGQNHNLLNSNLAVEFDEDGNLVAIEGEADAPQQLSDNVTLNTAVRSVVGYYTGAELNQMDGINIDLKDHIRYFVYMISNEVDLTIDNRDGSGPEQVVLTPPANGKILLITDMSDPMFYRYIKVPGGMSLGHGDSYHGRLPFIPSLGYGKLQSFDGHLIDLGSTNIGFKIFDFFNFSGTWVTKIPTFNEVDLSDPFNSPLIYKMGMNGQANYGLSVLGVGVFSFPFGETSATLQVGHGNDHFAMRNTIAPVTPWLPPHMPYYNSSELTADWFVTDDDYEAKISGRYESLLPEASLLGTVLVTPSGVTMEAEVADSSISLAVDANFTETGYEANVEIPPALQDYLIQDVEAELDNLMNEVQAAVDSLTQATTDYEFEVSLRGIRSAIPAIADSAISSLNAMPNAVYSSVYGSALNYMKKTCWSTWLGKKCLSHFINEGSHARTAANRAKAEATAKRNAIVPILQDLKTQAQAADSETLRTALAQALQAAIDNRVVKVKAYYRIKVLGKYYTVINKTYTRTLINSSNTSKLVEAKSYIPYITETSEIMIAAQDIVDQLPTQEALQQVRDELQQGLTAVPTIEKIGISVEGENYVARVQLDGQTYETDVNMLSADAMRNYLSGVATDLLLGDL